MKITLQIFDRDALSATKVLSEGTYTLGRSDECDVVLKGNSVSRKHIELRVTDGNVYFTNVSVGQKIFHNSAIQETGELANGDTLEVSHFRIVVKHGEHAESNIFLKSSAAPSPDIQPEPVAPEPAFQPESSPPPMTEGTSALALAATQVHSKPVVAKLLFTEGPLAGEEIFLETYEVTFGRSKKADIFIDDPKLSRVHAKISRMGSGYRLVDLASRNGTYCNGMGILEHPLASYDVISFGTTKLNFIIHDVAAQTGLGKGADLTKSLQMTPSKRLELIQGGGPVVPPSTRFPSQGPLKSSRKPSLRVVLLAGVVLLGFMLMFRKDESPKVAPVVDAKTTVPSTPQPVEIQAISDVPKEFAALSEDQQRTIEGQYTEAMQIFDKGAFDESQFHLKKIHDKLPYYKQSRNLLEEVNRRLKEKELVQAKQKAEKDADEDLVVYIDDGIQYLRAGDFSRAEESFQAALNLDPSNELAKRGMKGAQLRITDIAKVPSESDEQNEIRKKLISLFEQAVVAVTERRYQEAIKLGEEIKTYKLKGDGQYLAEAQKIIDRATMLQKEEFEPFLIQAKEKYIEGAYNEARDLCEEMLKRDKSYKPAEELLEKTRSKLNALAQDNYQTGYVLESMGKIEEAKQYWNRAKTYTRPGDPYYPKIKKMLEKYD